MILNYKLQHSLDIKKKFWLDFAYLKDLLEVLTAGREDNFVSLDTFLLADQGHVDKLRLILEFAHTVDNVGLVVGPLDTELSAGHFERGWFLKAI